MALHKETSDKMDLITADLGLKYLLDLASLETAASDVSPVLVEFKIQKLPHVVAALVRARVIYGFIDL